jgi:hypothetical protein
MIVFSPPTPLKMTDSLAASVRKCFLNIIDRNGDKCHQNVVERHAGNGGDRWFAEMKCYLMAIIQH